MPIAFIIKNWKIMLGGGFLALLVGYHLYAVYNSYSKGYGACESNILTAKDKASQERDKIEQSIITLPKAEVQKRLEQKWCRDCS